MKRALPLALVLGTAALPLQRPTAPRRAGLLRPRATAPLRAQKDDDTFDDDIESFRRRLMEQSTSGATPNTPPPAPASAEDDVASFREKLLAGAMEFDRVTEAQNTPEATEWVQPCGGPVGGGLLIANPDAFFEDPMFQGKYGVQGFAPGDLPPDRLAELLPVVMLYMHGDLQSAGFVLNRRTGMMMGDLAEQHGLRCFQVQPIWYGGPHGEGQLSMVHTYPQVEGARKISDGLWLGGSFEAAQDEVTEGIASGWNFKFFLQVDAWGAGSLEDEVRRGWWLPARCSPQVVMKIRERGGGTLRPKPMWKEVLELAGDEYSAVQEDFYRKYDIGW